MNLLQAAAGQPQQPSPWGFYIMIGLMILVLWLFMWRPESKRRKEMQKFREGLKKGDKVITAGGIYGTVKEHGRGRYDRFAEIADRASNADGRRRRSLSGRRVFIRLRTGYFVAMKKRSKHPSAAGAMR